ncbi:hypothetical protein tpqmel_1055, partial [Candidatus Gastranaerophilus sp. (ex Termes propinquus)]
SNVNKYSFNARIDNANSQLYWYAQGY